MTKAITIHFTQSEYDKLRQLAIFRSKDTKRHWTVETCIKDFARTCMPGGPDGKHWSSKP